MYTLVRKTLEIYLREQKIITLADFPTELTSFLTTKEAVFVTLYYQGKVIASSGRISCKKENTLYECIDNTLLCLKDPRFTLEIQNLDKLEEIRIRTDHFTPENRRILQNISDLDVNREGLLLLSQNYGVMSVVLPHMLHIDTSPFAFLHLACQKAGLDESKLTPSDYVIYGLTTRSESDFG